MARRPLRIAMLSAHTCPLATLGGKKTGGMNVYVRDLSRELVRRGHHVDVFTRSEDPAQPRIRIDGDFGVRVIHVVSGPEMPIPPTEQEQYLAQFTEGVLQFAASEKLEYDVIHSHYWLSGLAAGKLSDEWSNGSHGRKIPVIHMFHTLGHMKDRVAASDGELVGQGRIDGEQRILEQADRIVAATEAEHSQLHWLYGADVSKVSIVPPGVDLVRFAPLDRLVARSRIEIPDDTRYILFVGRVEPLKGIDTLLQAVALIKERSSAVAGKLCVCIIGGDPWAEDPEEEMVRLRELPAQLGISQEVNFLGARRQRDLPDYYAGAEMIVVPSHYESFGLVALEAMAMARPVIASEVGGLAFLIQDGVNGYHVPSRDPEALAERIYELLQDGSCANELGARAREDASQYGWDSIAARIEAEYYALLG